MNLQEFLQQPLYKRQVFKWYWPLGWYILPKHIHVDHYDAFHDYLKDVYPHQYRLREKIVPYIINTIADFTFFPSP